MQARINDLRTKEGDESRTRSWNSENRFIDRPNENACRQNTRVTLEKKGIEKNGGILMNRKCLAQSLTGGTVHLQTYRRRINRKGRNMSRAEKVYEKVGIHQGERGGGLRKKTTALTSSFVRDDQVD